MSTLRITQRRSANGADARQRGTLRSLGLRRIGHSVEHPDSPQLRGMTHAVRHLVEVEEREPAVRRAPAGRACTPEPRPRQPPSAQARGSRRGLGHGQDVGSRPQGRRLALGRQGAAWGAEGGQNPIHMRMRKLRGPHMKKSMPFEPFRTRTQPVNLADLEKRFDKGAEVTPDSLRERGLAKRRNVPVKVLARGELSKALTVHAHGFSATARERIEAAGGTCQLLEG